MFKKGFLSIIVILSLCISNASANLITFGAGIEQQKITGYIQNGNVINYFNNSSAETDGNPNTGNLGLDNKNNPFVWLKLNIPLPVIPNFKFQYTRYHSTGHSNYIAGGTKIFGDVSIPLALTDANTELTINSFDATAYYNFNIFIANLSLGAGADIWKGKSIIHDNQTGVDLVNKKFTVVLPYLYGYIKTKDIYGFSLEGTAKWAKSGENHHYEYLGAIRYTLDITGPVNPFLEVGFKVKDVQGKDGNDLTKLKYKGAFATIGIDF